MRKSSIKMYSGIWEGNSESNKMLNAYDIELSCSFLSFIALLIATWLFLKCQRIAEFLFYT